MKDCDLVRELWPLKQEELLGPNTEELVSEHFKQCQLCRDWLEKEKDEDQILRQIPLESLEDDDSALVEKIMEIKCSRSRMFKYGILGALWGLISPAAMYDQFIITKLIAQIPRFIAAQIFRLLPGAEVAGRKYYLFPELDFFTWYGLAVLIGILLLLGYAYLTSKTKPITGRGFAALTGIIIILGGLWLGGSYALAKDKEEQILRFTDLKGVTMFKGRVLGLSRNSLELGEKDLEKLVQVLRSSHQIIALSPPDYKGVSHEFDFRYGSGRSYRVTYHPENNLVVFDYYYNYRVDERFKQLLTDLERGVEG